ncbi:fibronectin type III domain-containing protein [Sphingobacterium sp. DN00404]|uniref:Fibronectin type III domain-containing protein n=1 Tax=Sphingobacterium micropteri TaxID=2763501 RepID=A0ABR7YNH7_9SPHI|nr:fibronectin type III domain-containing protein [Sphingobacterium micropteri]MBD1432858.1 fibronectin type III domain-containing protein [Sphingobacterium micropteri]
MKYIRAKANFFRYPDDKLVVAASWIIRCMKRSTIFINPTPSIVEIEEAYAEYYQKLVESAGGSRLMKVEKRASKKRLSNLLQELVFYVNVVSDGDLVKLYSSGFPVLTGKRKGQPPNTPGSPFLTDGRKSGEVAFGFQPVGRDMLYDYCFATKVDGSNIPVWEEERTTSRSFKAYQDGFEPGQYIYFRVRARNKHGCSPWTPTVMFMVR